MSRKHFTQSDKEAFVAQAKKKGMSRTMREMGYPSSLNTAKAWMKEANITITEDTLGAKAKVDEEQYGFNEEMYLLKQMMDKIHTNLEDPNLNADGVVKLASALQKCITTMELIGGNPTSRTAQQTQVTDELQALLNQTKIRNKNEAERLLKSL